MSEKSWDEIVREIPEFIKSDMANGTLDLSDRDNWDEYAHEWADSSEYVIYYHHSRRLWAESSHIQEWESEAQEIAGPAIDDLITACVYFALRYEIVQAIEQIAGEGNE